MCVLHVEGCNRGPAVECGIIFSEILRNLLCETIHCVVMAGIITVHLRESR